MVRRPASVHSCLILWLVRRILLGRLQSPRKTRLLLTVPTLIFALVLPLFPGVGLRLRSQSLRWSP